MLKRLKRETLRERIVEEVKRAIIEGDLKPGDRLPTEMELAESLGVSRSSVREATKALEFIGVLNSSPKNGCTVGSFDMRGVVDQLRFHIQAHRATLEELLDARVLLEVGVLPLVVMRAEDEDIEALHECVEGMRKALIEGQDGFDEDLSYHSLLFKAARNKVLESFSDVIVDFFVVLRREMLTGEDEAELVMKDHEEIFDAIRSRDAARAQKAMSTHLERVRHRIVQADLKSRPSGSA